jgi:hypothetical protein
MSERARARFNDVVITVAVAAFLGLQAWTLKSVVELQSSVARLEVKITDHIEHVAINK